MTTSYQIRIDVGEDGIQTIGAHGLRPMLHVATGEVAGRLARLGVAGCYVLDFGGAFYCGTAGRLGRRLREHLASANDELRRVIAIVSEPGMTRCEAEQLEHLLIAGLARGRVPLLNAVAPGPAYLRAAETRTVDDLWTSAKMLLRGIGIDVPDLPVGSDAAPTTEQVLGTMRITQAGDLHVLICDGVHAVVWRTGRGWVVMPGSLIRRDPVPSAPRRSQAERERLRAEGHLVDTADKRVLMLLKPVRVESASGVVVLVMGAKHQPGRVLRRLSDLQRPRSSRP